MSLQAGRNTSRFQHLPDRVECGEQVKWPQRGALPARSPMASPRRPSLQSAALSRVLPRAQMAHFPFAPRRTARCALQPGFGPLPDIAREKIAAGGSFLGVGRSKRRNGAPRSGVRVFPRHAGVFAAPCQHLIHGSPGHQEIRLRWHLGGRPVLSQSQGAGVLRLVFFRKQIVELVRKAASGDDKAECNGARAGQIGRVRRWPRSHIRHMRQRTPRANT
jgi:hypothetical protein